jgi:tripartite-type tricarboxylate transporter receptor subunit TctC
MFSTIPNVLDFLRGGELRAIGVTTTSRAPVLPDAVPVAEQGFPGYDVKGWVGFAVPKGTPPDIVAELNRRIVAALARRDLKDRLAKIGMDASEPMSPAQTRDFVKREIDQWTAVVKAANIPPPQ